jgi:hypothetical protein
MVWIKLLLWCGGSHNSSEGGGGRLGSVFVWWVKLLGVG